MMSSVGITADIERSVQDFIYKEVRLLDQGKWREWQKLFDSDALYWVPATLEDHDPKRHISIIYDDQHLLELRLERMESEEHYAQQPRSRTLHQVSNLTVERRSGAAFVQCNMVIYEFKPNSQRPMEGVSVFPAFAEYLLLDIGDSFLIRSKKVSLLNVDGNIPDLTFLI